MPEPANIRQSLPDLWVCGDTRGELYPPGSPAQGAVPAWAWDSQAAPDLPDDRRPWFTHMDEIKPVDQDGEPCVLIASSGPGGAVLVRRSDRRILLSAGATGAHSAELLPGGWVAVAADVGFVGLFHISDGHATAPRASAPLPSAHGLVYERSTGLLWACGNDRVVAFRVDIGKPAFEVVQTIQLPQRWSHDLSADPRDGGLIVTTQTFAWRVNTKTLAVAPYEPLTGMVAVKSISVEAGSGIIAFQKGEGGHWWSDTIYLLGPGQRLAEVLLPGRKLYKARWDQSCQLT